MSLRVFSPVGEIAPLVETGVTRLAALHGRRAGFVFNHHPACVELWQQLEAEIERAHAPPLIRRIAKPNISVPQPRAQLAELAAEVDYALVGVGA